MPEPHIADPMREALVILGSAAIVIPLFHRFRVSPVLGYMLVGLLVGPAGLGALTEYVPYLSFVTISDRARIRAGGGAGRGAAAVHDRAGTVVRADYPAAAHGVRAGHGAGGGLHRRGGRGGAGAGRAAHPGGDHRPGPGDVVHRHRHPRCWREQRRVTGRVGRVSFAVLLFQDLAVVPVLFAVAVLGTGRGRGGRLSSLPRPRRWG